MPRIDCKTEMKKKDLGKKIKRPRSQNNNHMNSLKYANMQCSRDRASQACSDGGLYMYDRKKCVERVRPRGYHSSKTHNPSNRQIRVNDLSKKGGVGKERRTKSEGESGNSECSYHPFTWYSHGPKSV